MSRVKSRTAHSMLSGLVSDSEEDQINTMPTQDSASENPAPAKRGRGRPKTASSKVAKPMKVVKSKAPHRTSGRLSTKSGRTALQDKTNEAAGNDEFMAFEDVAMEDADEGDEPVEVPQQANSKTAKRKGAIQPRPAKDLKSAKEPSHPVKKGRRAKHEVFGKESLPEIQETQVQNTIDLDESVLETFSLSANNNSRQQSRPRPRRPSLLRRRAGSGSDAERTDPALRRKIGDLTARNDALTLKYRDLSEIGTKEAEQTFERMRKQRETEIRRSDALVKSLKEELAAQTALAKDTRGLKKTLDEQFTAVATLQARIVEITISLSEAQSENKTLATKLAANRTAAASIESANAPRIPGSAMKANGGIRLIGTAEAAQVAQAAQLKEDLYSDLTGLIIRSVKHEADEDIFDCIQTGRNGTLHFKLATSNEMDDDAECRYVPQLDPSRDKDTIELLPDYLVDEITFPRPQAAKFFARVVKALTEKPL